MTQLSEIVEINRRFARSARIDADLRGTPPLIGYVLQASVAKALTTMASSQVDSQQGAFTWTGPYGGGKSSAALLIANLVAGTKANRKIARDIAGPALTTLFGEAFPEDDGGWDVVAVTGSRVRLRDVVADAAAEAFEWSAEATAAAKTADDSLISALMTAATHKRSGVLLILDELGKMLEHEALEGGDVHLLQDIAEHASRSSGHLVVIGILHQSFDQYAARAARDARQEWAKVQGRYQDIAFLSGADETVALLGRAIAAQSVPGSAQNHAIAVAEAVAKRRPTETALLAQALADAWPLNPVCALLLGPVSRQRFAQNERSVFGFLSSAEPAGFQEFLTMHDERATYDPARLWDLPALFEELGAAAAAANRPVAIFVDELQSLKQDEFSALIMAVHKVNQRELPILFIGAGLPQVMALAGNAKSYSERLFNFSPIDALCEQDAVDAIVNPAAAEEVKFEAEAVSEILRVTERYPYYLQQWAHDSWNLAEGDTITWRNVVDATPISTAALDRSFFRVRYDRCSPNEKTYMRALAELGPGHQKSAEVAGVLGKTVNQISPARAQLIKKAMIFAQSPGTICFTVPLFDQFMKRVIPRLPDRT